MPVDKLEWSGWQDLKRKSGGYFEKTKWPEIGHSPYVHWTTEIGGDGLLNREVEDQKNPIPKYARNRGFDWKTLKSGLKGWADDTRLKDITGITPETVIVGIIDRGIPLGHNRFRDKKGMTRILAAWQCIADRKNVGTVPLCDSAKYKKVGGSFDKVPYGTDFTQTEIDALIEGYSKPDRCGYLDEDEFNRATGGEDYLNLVGDRGLGRRYAHGAHMMDAAAGYDPLDPKSADFVELVRLLTVNLPSRQLLGPSGRLLEFFVIIAMRRILDVADRIWDIHCNPQKKKKFSDTRGFPIVLNLSFAKQVSRRDGFDFLAREISKINKKREGEGRLQVRYLLPAGNENLARGHAQVQLAPGAKDAFDWNVLPEDQTANYVEIWNRDNAAMAKNGSRVPLAIQVTTPNGVQSGLSAGKPGQINTLMQGDQQEAIARIYCRIEEAAPDDDKKSDVKSKKKEEKEEEKRINYVVATRHTNLYEPETPVAPAGLWKIDLQCTDEDEMTVTAGVQSDQSNISNSGTGKLSYFNDRSYERFDKSGALLDSFDYPTDDPTRKPKNCDGSNIVRRHGTLNALATGSRQGINLLGGYRDSDGKPAKYSGTGLGVAWDKGRSLPTVSFPTDDGAAHFGTLAAGARNGSVVALRGTSSACARAARVYAEGLVEKLKKRAASKKPIVKDEHLSFMFIRLNKDLPPDDGSDYHAARPEKRQFGQTAKAKVGRYGRVPDKTRTLRGIYRIPRKDDTY